MNHLKEKIEREADKRHIQQWHNEACDYAHEKTKTYADNVKDLCFYERTFGYEQGVQAGFTQGANFALDMDRWVKVEDGLPESDPVYTGLTVDVLITDGKHYGVGYYRRSEGSWMYTIDNPPTHWQPLPKLPDNG